MLSQFKVCFDLSLIHGILYFSLYVGRCVCQVNQCVVNLDIRIHFTLEF